MYIFYWSRKRIIGEISLLSLSFKLFSHWLPCYVPGDCLHHSCRPLLYFFSIEQIELWHNHSFNYRPVILTKIWILVMWPVLILFQLHLQPLLVGHLRHWIWCFDKNLIKLWNCWLPGGKIGLVCVVNEVLWGGKIGLVCVVDEGFMRMMRPKGDWKVVVLMPKIVKALVFIALQAC